MSRRVIAVTSGDVAGIGPETIVRAVVAEAVAAECIPLVIGHPQILEQAIELTGLHEHLTVRELTTAPEARGLLADGLPEPRTGKSHVVACWNPAGDGVLNAPKRRENAASGDAAFQYLTAAVNLARRGIVDAIATAPLNKAALYLAGHHFPGHTEILAQQCGVDQFAMMLHLPETRLQPLRSLVRQHGLSHVDATHGLSIVHVTLHTSVASVPTLLTTDGIIGKIRLMDDFLRRIGCQRGSIGVCALNPHGGENGLFGDEESRLIGPAVETCAGSHIHVTGPHPVDTVVRRAVAGEFDGLVAMYHDQGHIPVKLIGFDAAVNITLGLPIVRTSPTHGTAFDRAWNPATPADESGMIEAIRTAVKLCD